jgi:integrase
MHSHTTTHSTVSALMRAYLPVCPFKDRARILQDFAKYRGRWPVSQLTVKDLYTWLAWRPRWQSEWTKRHCVQQVLAVLAWAESQGHIPKNPLKSFRYSLSPTPRTVSPDQFRALLRASDANYRRFLAFIYFTGARPAEARHMRWPDVDLAKAQIRTAFGFILVGDVADKLLRWLHARSSALEGEVFRNSYGDPWTKKALDERFPKLREKAQLPCQVTYSAIRAAFTLVVRKGNTKLLSLAQKQEDLPPSLPQQ